jgi:hypothetical protein
MSKVGTAMALIALLVAIALAGYMDGKAVTGGVFHNPQPGVLPPPQTRAGHRRAAPASRTGLRVLLHQRRR